MRGTRSITALLLLAANLSTTGHAAEQVERLDAMGPWKADGRAYQIADQGMLFVGVFSGVMVLQENGHAFDAAEFDCPGTQEIDYAAERTRSSGLCVIETSAANKVFARWQCEGAIGDCRGRMEIVAGTGSLEGISGGGEMRFQSFFADISEDEDGEVVVDKAIGVVNWPQLEIRIPMPE